MKLIDVKVVKQTNINRYEPVVDILIKLYYVYAHAHIESTKEKTKNDCQYNLDFIKLHLQKFIKTGKLLNPKNINNRLKRISF